MFDFLTFVYSKLTYLIPPLPRVYIHPNFVMFFERTYDRFFIRSTTDPDSRPPLAGRGHFRGRTRLNPRVYLFF